MKETSLKKACRRGFTLIELMIVIVILGILMGAIVPRVRNSVARGRDTARIADMNNIANALKLYYADEEQYPDTNACLDGGSSDAVTDEIKGYLTSEIVPHPPSEDQLTSAGSISGCKSYVYVAVDGGEAFALVSDVEIYQNANTNLSAVDSGDWGDYDELKIHVGAGLSEETDPPTDSAYVVLYR